MTTCPTCLSGSHLRCRGCACSVCARRVQKRAEKGEVAQAEPVRKEPARTLRNAPPDFSKPRREKPEPLMPVDELGQRVIGVLGMLRNYQLTGRLEEVS